MNRFMSIVAGTTFVAATAFGNVLGGMTEASAATPASVSPKIEPGTWCNNWISGSWGHARCYNHSKSRVWMKIHVECDAWWDANIDRKVLLEVGQDAEQQGECYSSVDWVTSDTYH